MIVQLLLATGGTKEEAIQTASLAAIATLAAGHPEVLCQELTSEINVFLSTYQAFAYAPNPFVSSQPSGELAGGSTAGKELASF